MLERGGLVPLARRPRGVPRTVELGADAGCKVMPKAPRRPPNSHLRRKKATRPVQKRNQGGVPMYQQLKGALGREVYFRAPRVRASWISGKEQPDVRFAGAPARLCDLSLSGMLLDLAPDSVPFGNTNEFPIELSLGNEVFFRGTGVAVRHEERTRGRRIAIRLLGNLTD